MLLSNENQLPAIRRSGPLADQLLLALGDGFPTAARQRSIGGLDHSNGGEGIAGRHHQGLFASNGASEVFDLILERFHLVVTGAEHGPIRIAAAAELRLPPAHEDGPPGPVNSDEVGKLFTDAPGEIDAS